MEVLTSFDDYLIKFIFRSIMSTFAYHSLETSDLGKNWREGDKDKK